VPTSRVNSIQREGTKFSLLYHMAVKKGDVVSIVGSGGKTTLMYLLAQELVERGDRVIITITTKIYPPHPDESSQLIVSEKEDVLLNKAQKLLQKEKKVVLAEKFIGPKLKGLSPTLIDKIREQRIADVILIEADGAKYCPLKAPNETEPVIPLSTTWTLPVVGLDGIGEKNIEQYVFRPHYFARLAGIEEGAMTTPESVSRIVLHPEGLTKGTPRKAKIVLFLNKGEITKSLEFGKEVARLIMKVKNRSIMKILITTLIPVPKVIMAFNFDSSI